MTNKKEIIESLRGFFKEPSKETFELVQSLSKEYSDHWNSLSIYGSFLKELKLMDTTKKTKDLIFAECKSDENFADLCKFIEKDIVKNNKPRALDFAEFCKRIYDIQEDTGIFIYHISGFSDIDEEFVIHSNGKFMLDHGNNSYKFIKTTAGKAWSDFLSEANRVRLKERKEMYSPEEVPEKMFQNYIKALPSKCW